MSTTAMKIHIVSERKEDTEPWEKNDGMMENIIMQNLFPVALFIISTMTELRCIVLLALFF